MKDRAVEGTHRLLRGRVGLRFDPSLRFRLERCLVEAAAAHGMADDIDAFSQRLVFDDALFQDLLNRITVQETSFFRDPAQFAAIADHVLPSLPDAVHLWSAGCATGQEAYSLAMLLDEAGRTGSILATDISTAALERADTGIYSEPEVRGVSPERLARHFRAIGPDRSGGPRWQVQPRLRQMVGFRHHNLADERTPEFPGRCAAILCRNVLIYMTREDLLRILSRFRRILAPRGHLFLGYSESLWQASDDFRLTRVGDAFAYLPSTAGAAAAAPGRRRSARSPRPTNADTGTAAPRPRQDDPTELPAVADLLAEGEASVAAGETDAAITTFRQAVYLDPDHPLAHFNLGLCLESAGQPQAARRAFLAARDAVGRCDRALVQAALEGYGIDDLSSALAFKLSPAP